MNNWVSQDTDLLPDFIIGGAMKCGTSTLHTILNKHPKIFIPKEEVHFFDMDNILQHSDFNFHHNEKWTTQSMQKDPKIAWEWYQNKFRGHESLIKGEDSTTYLASKIAAERISMQKKEIKLLFLLRQPSLRAYSNYNHLLKSGRATYTFEDTIRFNPFQVLNRSLYKEQLESFYNYIPKERIKVILFEDLVEDPELIIKEVSEFIGFDDNEFPADVFKTHSNQGRVPRNEKLHVKKNLVMRNFGNIKYSSNLPFAGPSVKTSTPLMARVINKVHSKINPAVPVTQKINQETKVMLDDYFFKEMQGLDELLGKDVLSRWFPDKTISKN